LGVADPVSFEAMSSQKKRKVAKDLLSQTKNTCGQPLPNRSMPTAWRCSPRSAAPRV